MGYVDDDGDQNDGDDVLYALHAARVTSRPAERRVGTRLAGRARRDACLCLPASLPALDARRRDAQRRRRSRASAESHELRREPAVARSPPTRKGCSMRPCNHSALSLFPSLSLFLDFFRIIHEFSSSFLSLFASRLLCVPSFHLCYSRNIRNCHC